LEPNAPEHVLLPAGFRVMFAGNIGAAQDFPTILKAAEKLKCFPDIHWIIIGDGRIRPWLETQIEDRGLTKIFHLIGSHPVELMPRFFSLADIMLVTLKKEYIFSLTIPAKVQSYLASAKPIVAALDGEGARIVEEAGAGITCPTESPVALSEAILAMYHMPDSVRKNMGVKGRSYFENNFERTMLLDRLDVWMKELQKEVVRCAF
jgi:glycosyltransferase involved in cell wall biosynthesis